MPDFHVSEPANEGERALLDFALWIARLSDEEQRSVSLTGIMLRADAALRRREHELARNE